MFYLGIDVSLKSHRCALLDSEGEKVGTSFSIDSSPEGFEKLLTILRERNVDPSQLTAGLEATGHLWENLFSFLEGQKIKTVLLNPFQTNRYRELLSKKAKTDDIDAFCIAGLLRSGEGRACYVPDDQVQGLRDLVRTRNSFISNLQDYQRQANSLLQVVFPEISDILKDPFGKVAGEILSRYPTAKDLALVHPRKLEKIARAFQGNNFDRKKAEEMVALAKRSIYSGKAQKARGDVLRFLLRQIIDLKNTLAQLEATIEETLNTPTQGPSEIDLITSIPGVGPKTAAVLIAEIGDISRFASANHLVGYFGFFPQIRESGGKMLGTPKISPRGPKHFRKALYMAAVASLKHNREMKSIYDRKVSQGKAPKQALIVVARKLLATVYSLLRYQTAYEPGRLCLAPA
jgi:transposase